MTKHLCSRNNDRYFRYYSLSDTIAAHAIALCAPFSGCSSLLSQPCIVAFFVACFDILVCFGVLRTCACNVFKFDFKL